MDTVTIDGVTYDIPNDAHSLVLQELFVSNGLKPVLFSRLDPDYVRPNDTLDDRL